MATLERIDFISHSGDSPELICSFYWSDNTGLTCTDADLVGDLERNGIATPPDGAKVYPRDGRACFLALKWRGASFLEVTAPRTVEGTA